MFTVKLVEHNGYEICQEVTEVWAEKHPTRHDDHNVHARKPDGDVVHFSDYGSLFVMNSSGKTVASYHLGYGEDAVNENSASGLVTQPKAA